MTERCSRRKRQTETLLIHRHVRAPCVTIRYALPAIAWFALALLSSIPSRPALAGGDAALGEKVFNQCKVCHTVVDGKNAVGPSLFGVVGRKAGSAVGFNYSDAMVKAGEGGLTWDAATLDAYLKEPKSKVPGNKMMFVGLKNEEDRENVISYIKSRAQ
jgi:cytochrome c